MDKKPLKIISVEQGNSQRQKESYAGGKSRRLEAKAKYDRLWLQEREKMDPSSTCMERERIERTLNFVQKYISLEGKAVADLGCGSGYFARLIRDQGGTVDALDVSDVALKLLQKASMTGITPIQDCIPSTSLKDDAYDLVVCLDLIALLQQDEYRLLISELARLVKRDGRVVCSSPLDFHTDEAFQKFYDLFETEFDIENCLLSYHSFYIKLCDFLKAPARFAKAGHNNAYRQHQVENRSGFSRIWFKYNTAKMPSAFWRFVQFLFNPIASFLEQNKKVMLFLEKICRFLKAERGVSHAVMMGKRRPLFVQLPADQVPKETKHKKQLWE